MKKQTALWIFLHLIIVVLVGTGFVLFRQHVMYQAIVINDESKDKGIALFQLKTLIGGIKDKYPDCKILSVRKYYGGIDVKTAWIDEPHKGILLQFCESEKEWSQNAVIQNPIVGISPSELMEILNLVEKEPDDLVDKRVLSVVIEEGKVEVKTGVTNHSMGGGGNILRFEKVGDHWVRESRGSWIS